MRMEKATKGSLLLASVLLCSALLFWRPASSAEAGEWVGLAKRSRSSLWSDHPNCSRDIDWILRNCQGNGTTLEGLCTVTTNPDNMCEKTVSCSQRQGRWSATDACLVKCWASMRPFRWYFQHNTRQNLYYSTMDAELTTYLNNGIQLPTPAWTSVLPHTYLTEVQAHINRMDLRRIRSFTLRTVVPNCGQ